MKKLILLITLLAMSFNLNAQCWNSIYESGYGYNCFKIRNDGTLWSNGDSTLINGQYDPNTGNGYSTPTPTQIGTANNWKSISNGSYHIAAIKTDGTLWTWGDNFGGQLGNGTTINNYTPTQIGNSTNWKSVSSGYDFNIAVKTDGTLWSWGMNNYGELGNGTTIQNYTPNQIGTATNWKSVSAGREQSLAIKTDGTLWVWGLNDYGQLGDGTNINKSSPIQIGTSNNWKQVTAGNWFSTAIKNDGTLFSCGRNDYGQLGDGTTVNKNNLTQIICTALDVEEFKENSFKIYPNPVSNELNVKTDSSLINQPYTIIDGLGRVVLKGKLNEVESTINVEQLSKGIYYLKIASNNATKFIKE